MDVSWRNFRRWPTMCQLCERAAACLMSTICFSQPETSGLHSRLVGTGGFFTIDLGQVLLHMVSTYLAGVTVWPEAWDKNYQLWGISGLGPLNRQKSSILFCSGCCILLFHVVLVCFAYTQSYTCAAHIAMTSFFAATWSFGKVVPSENSSILCRHFESQVMCHYLQRWLGIYATYILCCRTSPVIASFALC